MNDELENKLWEKAYDIAQAGDPNSIPGVKAISGIFADLIIKECVLQCHHNDDMDRILAHFGVE